MKNKTQDELKQELKADLPPTTWGKILGATPVVMAVVATMTRGSAGFEDRGTGCSVELVSIV